MPEPEGDNPFAYSNEIDSREASECHSSATATKAPPPPNNLHQLPSISARPKPLPTDNPLVCYQKLAYLCGQIPCSPSDPLKAFLSNPSFDVYILAQHDRLVKQWYFKPVDNHKKVFQRGVMSRLQGSMATSARWIALIGMSICEAFIIGDSSQIQVYNLWLKGFERRLGRELLHDTTSREIQERRSDWIHVSLLQTLTIHASYIYQILQSIAPTFLQVVFSDPHLWPNDYNPTHVPLSSILCSEAHELAYFALIDCSCAMALGVPQQLEYDTTIYPWSSSSSLHQWVHGSPTEFQLVLADINACRDKSPNARDWKDIEHWLLAWQSRSGEHVFTESWMTVAWYAVQESWRLALLVYLYLAVCNVSSDNPQIQSYIKQILQVVGTVKKQESSGEVSFLIQYLIAGICARNETHRRLVRSALANNNETTFWIMRGSDLVPVLDHLWHGAAAYGSPVKWNDYLHSRTTVLPLSI
ncbi:hypothetical protein RSOLAG1IB_06469 [Rhizoctonia solani AG-1 IB]|uniref:Fungal zn(2)-Cys(6) binuclear cluster domain-containing protein n=1 Tax=Thanatephorus cucumeris (strain AG1-IB / isolate 7/3/14) TaxID=1108050 RepID=A0A0B7F9Q8_THACB|nr:hypothetical protein RSOLAG1IB_06469 [Rhizoctonia solani AG-1 IB]